MKDFSEYEQVRNEAEKFYGSLKPIYSPALNENIHFTAEGFNHLLFRGSRLERDRKSQMLRFKLLELAISLIDLSTTYQEFEETIQKFETKTAKKSVLKNKGCALLGNYRHYPEQKDKGNHTQGRRWDNAFLEYHSFLEYNKIPRYKIFQHHGGKS